MAIDPPEFNFGSHKAAKPSNGWGRKSNPSSLDEDPTAVVFKGPERPKNFSSSSTSKKEPDPMHTATATPTPLDARKNIARQKREQRVVSTVLGGAATGLLLFIILVGALAGLGGYVLWKQIHEQSVTISLMETNLRQEIVMLRDDLEKANQGLSKKVVNLQAHVDEHRSALKNLGSDLETERNKNQRQDLLLNRIERNAGSVLNRLTNLETHMTKSR